MYENKVTNYENINSKKVFTIECKYIVLREFQFEDLDELYALTLQSEITDILPDWRGTKEQRKDWLINVHIKGNREFLETVPNVGDHWLIVGIILKKTNEFIGWCCSGPSDELPKPNREIAYAISKYHRNKGYTTQAAQGLIKFGASVVDKETRKVIGWCGLGSLDCKPKDIEIFYGLSIKVHTFERFYS